MKAKALKWLSLLVFFSLFALAPSFLWAGEVDILINKLVEKGILMKQDADGILEEIRQETAPHEKKMSKKKRKQEKRERKKQARMLMR